MKDNQTNRLLKALRDRPLTGMEIMLGLHIMNYKGRIHDLRKSHRIETEMIKRGKARVARYRLAA